MTVVSREIIRAKYGKSDELLKILTGMQKHIHYPFTRVLTDLEGTSFTTVMEIEASSLGEWKEFMHMAFADPKFNKDFNKMAPLIDQGHRELFRMVDPPYEPYKADPPKVVLVRNVFQAKYGMGDALVKNLAETVKILSKWNMDHEPRVLVDVSCPFFTVVTEQEMSNLTQWEEFQGKMFNTKEFNTWFEKMVPLVEHGRREFYNVVNFDAMTKHKPASRVRPGPARRASRRR